MHIKVVGISIYSSYIYIYPNGILKINCARKFLSTYIYEYELKVYMKSNTFKNLLHKNITTVSYLQKMSFVCVKSIFSKKQWQPKKPPFSPSLSQSHNPSMLLSKVCLQGLFTRWLNTHKSQL